jgi:tRNA dimethylallyltransferase
MQQPFSIVLTGPTGVGKTDFANELGKHLPIEIINLDAGQWYEPLTIGTAKPDWKHEHIPHHLFDVCSRPEDISVVRYRQLAVQKMQEIWQRGNVPVFVGGSLFYLYSLIFPPKVHVGSIIDQESFSSRSTQELWDELSLQDKERALAIHPNDRYRITRALMLIKQGIIPSKQQPDWDPVSRLYIICLTREKDDLQSRISKRVHVMLNQGWAEEVAHLDDDWKQFVIKKGFIGYPELIASHYQASAEVAEQIERETKAYAKRQMTFWRKVKKEIARESEAGRHGVFADELNLTLCDHALYINQLLRRISSEHQIETN